MVAIGLSAGAVARVRFAISPLWETVAALRVLRDPGAHALHLPWAGRVRRHLGRVTATRLWRLVPAGPGYLPDFLTPPPAGPFANLDEELTRLVAAPPDEVARQLRLIGAAPVPVAQLADDARECFELLLAVDWPRIRVLLEAEVFHRARTLASKGVGGLLGDLHPQVRWADDTLTVTQPYCTAADVPDGGGLVLIPSVFVWPSVLTVSVGPDAQLAYPARGIGALWEQPPETPDGLAGILGRSRARLLVELAAPASTTALARRTGLTPGGVSQHLGALRAAGLVAAHRAGREVLNIRTPLADALVDAGIDANGRRE